MNFRLEVHNKGGHSSLPVKDNAIYHLAGALHRLSDFDFPLKPTKSHPPTSSVCPTRRWSKQGSSSEGLSGDQAAMQQIAASAPAWNATLRTTCVALSSKAVHAMNALPQRAAATVNCRVLPEDSPQYVEDTLRKLIADDQVALKTTGGNEPRPRFTSSVPIFSPRSQATGKNLARRACRSRHGHGRHRWTNASRCRAFPLMAFRAFSSTATTSASTAAMNASPSNPSTKARPFSTTW